jgi:hypothetical protein
MFKIKKRVKAETKNRKHNFSREHIKAHITEIFARLGAHFKKLYVFPSHQKIRELLQKWYGITTSKSTLIRALNELNEEGWFTKIVRNHNDGTGHMAFKSTLYKFKYKMVNLMHIFHRIGRAIGNFIAVSHVTLYKKNNTYVSSSSLRHFSSNKGYSSILGVFEKCERQSMTGKSPPD